MKVVAFLLCLFILSFSGCDVRQREMEYEKKMAALNQKEQELLLKEKTLQLKEEELMKREQLLDSNRNRMPTDTVVYDPGIIGMWSAKMVNTETSCTGAAIGDTKTEQWQIGYQNGSVIIQALVDNKLVRVYTGAFNGDVLEFVAQQNEGEAQQATNITVRLQQTAANRMEGRREIIRPDGCKIVYSLELVKQ